MSDDPFESVPAEGEPQVETDPLTGDPVATPPQEGEGLAGYNPSEGEQPAAADPPPAEEQEGVVAPPAEEAQVTGDDGAATDAGDAVDGQEQAPAVAPRALDDGEQLSEGAPPEGAAAEKTEPEAPAEPPQEAPKEGEAAPRRTRSRGKRSGGGSGTTQAPTRGYVLLEDKGGGDYKRLKCQGKDVIEARSGEYAMRRYAAEVGEIDAALIALPASTFVVQKVKTKTEQKVAVSIG